MAKRRINPFPTFSSRGVALFASNKAGAQIDIAALVLLGLYCIAISWRKWPDPQIDFGRELYLPWRITQGAVLYRDLEGHYGPLSQYFNSLLFALFGAGLMILVAANLVIFGGSATMLYLLCRRSWGRAAAFVATAIFISVFGFSQFVHISNYNYATPYAHETTHGIFVVLLLALTLSRWIETATTRLSFAAGLLLGATAVLKPEFTLAGVAISGTAFALHWRMHGKLGVRMLCWFAFATIIPSLVFAFYFMVFMPMREAFVGACGAWIHFVLKGAQPTGIQGSFSGVDQADMHVAEHVRAILAALGVIALVALAATANVRIKSARAVAIFVSLLAAVVAWFSFYRITWIESGRSFLGLVVLYLIVEIVLTFRNPADAKRAMRLIIALLAAALMARMILSGRIYHYGFYQAALAGSILPAILIGEVPEWLRLRARAQWIFVALTLALLVPGVVTLVRQSRATLQAKIARVGEGRDAFYTFPARLDPTGEIVGAIATYLHEHAAPDETLFVAPEGIMLNYLTRMRSPVPWYFFANTNDELIAQLSRNPPNWVVMISRNLREYGVVLYGEKPGAGQELIRWLDRDYQRVAHVGGNPFDLRERGAFILQRKAPR